MIRIDPFTGSDADYAAIVATNRALYADDTSTVEELRHYDSSRNPDYLYQRYILRWGDVPVGHGVLYVSYWAYVPGKYGLYAAVHPDFQRRGIGRAFYDFGLAELAGLEPKMTSLQSYTRTDTPQGSRFLEARGFAAIMRWWDSKLVLADFAPETYMPLLEKLAAEGVEIITAAELATRDPDWQRSIHHVDHEATLDEPQPNPPTPISFEEYAKLVYENPLFRAERVFVAVDGDKVVGMTELPINPVDPRNLQTGFTGILRSHRRRGIATALKVVALRYAKENDVLTVTTGNEENNPMYQLNLRLGFQPTVASLAYVREL